MATDTFVVVGGGLAAARAVEELRERGFGGRLVLVAGEGHRPYERPPLSKGHLLGSQDLDEAFVHPADWYDAHGVDLRVGSRATALDPGGHTVTVAGDEIGYDRLLLATGARVRRLAGADEAAAAGAPVTYLRTMEDSARIRAALAPGRRVVVVGGGWIGLEVAAAARIAGCEVDVVEALEAPLVRVLGPEVAGAFRDLHEGHGVRVRTRVSLASVERSGEAATVRLDDGTALDADLVVVGVGVVPDAELAEAAGLDTDDGIVVDERLRTSHPDVFAAGDVANAHHPLLGRRLRVEHWDNAAQQGRTAARNLLGAEESYRRLPYFFTDQYDLGMEYVGHVGPQGYDEVVVRGDPGAGVFTAFWVGGGAVLAGMQANDWDATDAIRRIVSAGRVDLAALRDADVPLGRLAG